MRDIPDVLVRKWNGWEFLLDKGGRVPVIQLSSPQGRLSKDIFLLSSGPNLFKFLSTVSPLSDQFKDFSLRKVASYHKTS